jgi:excisionase family DNA binding protein
LHFAAEKLSLSCDTMQMHATKRTCTRVEGYMEELSYLLDRRDAAKALSISLRKLEGLILAGELPVRRIGRRVLIPRQALETFAALDKGSPSQ